MKTIALCGVAKSGRTYVTSKFIEQGFVDLDLGVYKEVPTDTNPISTLLINWRKLTNTILLQGIQSPGIVIDGISTKEEIDILKSNGILCVYVHSKGGDLLPADVPGLYQPNPAASIYNDCDFTLYNNASVAQDIQRLLQTLIPLSQ